MDMRGSRAFTLLASIEGGRLITPRTTFTLGSASKPFTALAVLMLEQQGRLSLDDDVRRWVPELPNYGSPIRIRDLVQHTSGLRDYSALSMLSGRSVTSMAEFLGLIAAQRAVNFAPGTRHEYSHSDYLLLGLIVERVVGIPFGEHLEREVLQPMGMKESFVSDERPRSTWSVRSSQAAIPSPMPMAGVLACTVGSARSRGAEAPEEHERRSSASRIMHSLLPRSATPTIWSHRGLLRESRTYISAASCVPCVHDQRLPRPSLCHRQSSPVTWAFMGHPTSLGTCCRSS